jgi:hypothetical protein
MGCSSEKRPLAKNGILDLSDYNFKEKGVIKLNGQWKFYWKQLLSPEDFNKDHIKAELITMPSRWNGMVIDGKRLSGDGYATFTLETKLKKTATPLGIKVPEMSSAYRLWIDDTLYAWNGTVGNDKETVKPQFLPRIFTLKPKNETLKITLQIANFHDYDGGALHSIKLGLQEQIQRINYLDITSNVFMLGVLLIMSIYHLSLFLLRRDQYSALIFCLFCLVIALRTFLMGERMIVFLIPDINWELAARLEHITLYAILPLTTLFTWCLYQKIMSKNFVRSIVIICGVIIVAAAFLPVKTNAYIVVPYQILLLLSSIYILIVLIMAVVRKSEGAAVLLTGIVILYLSGINDILFDRGIIPGNFILPYGFLIFILSQAFALSIRFSKAYNRAEALSIELNDLNMLQERLLKKYEESRFNNLQKRMYPHFLFNALHTIHSLMKRNPEKSEEAIISLSEMYHFLLGKSFNSLISFEDEWNFTKNYLEFKKIEFPDTLHYEMIKDENLDFIKVPPLILQPVVENSLKHGIAGNKMGFIKIETSYDDKQITIIVDDNGRGYSHNDLYSGTLGNIKDRLRFYFPDSSFEMNNKKDNGVKTSIVFETQ